MPSRAPLLAANKLEYRWPFHNSPAEIGRLITEITETSARLKPERQDHHTVHTVNDLADHRGGLFIALV